jgi:predicted alpha/beta hydrolase family esterase
MSIKNITILHGYGVSPGKMWFPWIHTELEKLGYAVNIPAMPDSLRPNYRKWHSVAAPIARRWDANTLVIGHSVGGAFALRLIEREAKNRIAGLVLVSSPFTATINVRPYVKFFAQPMDWERISGMVKKISVIHAKNDPLVPYDHAVRYGEAFGAAPLLAAKGGHFVDKTCPPLMRVLRRDFEI